MKLFSFFAAALLPCALAGQESSVINLNKITSASFGVVLTEIMADPDPPFGLPDAEYVEIHNSGPATVNLNGWTLFEGSSRTLPDIDLLPGEYLVICANSDTIEFLPFGKVAGVSSLSLTNGGEKIALRNIQGIAVDSITYSDSWYGSSYKKNGGWSLERIDKNFVCPLAENWKPSENPNGGTPGTANSVAGIFTDHAAPVLLRAYCPDSISVMLVFSEAIRASTAEVIQNYTLVNAPIPLSAELADATGLKVLVKLSAPLLFGITGSVIITGLTDCAGNETASGSNAKFALTGTAMPGTIIINEILFNPLDGGYDFIEIYNKGFDVIDISEYRIASVDLESNEIDKIELISEEPWLIFPGDYSVLTEKPEIVATHYRSPYPYNFITSGKLPSMNVDAGHVAVVLNGEIIDEFKYDQNYHFPLLENVKGVSLEKIHPERNSMDPVSWHSAAPSAGFATPGLKNSQYAEFFPIKKQVSVSPEIFSPDFDGKDDVITFYVKTGWPGYISNIRIYDRNGFIIFENNRNNLIATGDAFSWDGIGMDGNITSPGIYIAVVELFNLNGDVKHYKLPFVLAAQQ